MSNEHDPIRWARGTCEVLDRVLALGSSVAKGETPVEAAFLALACAGLLDNEERMAAASCSLDALGEIGAPTFSHWAHPAGPDGEPDRTRYVAVLTDGRTIEVPLDVGTVEVGRG